MEEFSTVLSYLAYLLPALLAGGIAYYFFKTHTDHLENLHYHELHIKNQKEILPLRLQAYERLTLFLERISPGSLVPRVQPYNSDQHDYETLLIKTIEQEFEHNLSQQIYVSPKCWNVVKASKNATISLIRRANMNENIKDANKLREVILSDLLDKESPSDTGLAFVKDEVGSLWG
ncbi:MAG: hypothetical protein ACQESK_06030 [Bacteroidota bacterium]